MPYYCAIHPNQIVDNGAIKCPDCVRWGIRYDKAHAEGVEACKSGVRYSANPYKFKSKWAEEAGWRAGWYIEHCEANPRPASQ